MCENIQVYYQKEAMKILSLKFSKTRVVTRDEKGLNVGLKELCSF